MLQSYSVKKDEIFHTNSCMKQFCGYAKLPLVISYSVKKDVIFKYIGVRNSEKNEEI